MFVPISGWNRDNMLGPSANILWFKESKITSKVGNASEMAPLWAVLEAVNCILPTTTPLHLPQQESTELVASHYLCGLSGD